jgi:seryl-tRNA synthetase
MLDLKNLAQNFDEVVARLKRRGGSLDLGPVSKLIAERRELIIAVEGLRQKQNAANEDIKKKAKEDPGAIEKLRGELRAVSQEAKQKDERLREVEAELEKILLEIPNPPHPSVPDGAGAEQNVVVREGGQKPKFPFKAKEHWELGEKLGMLDFERAGKVSGPRFVFYKGALARLERALISFMLDVHTGSGYTELLPPFLVKREAMVGTSQLPKFEQDAFKTAGEHELFLVPTAEVPVTNYHADEILEGALPRKYVAYTPCFRAEAGSYGKDTKGLIRQHQFQKVELVKFATPETSYDEHEKLVADAESLLQKLGLPYRVMLLCAGDMGFGAAKCYDLEVWLPGQDAYREISSCSNFEDFQARRAKIRYRAEKGDKPRLVHTLNGSGLAVGRTVVAILENYQREDGTVAIPEVLWPYMGGIKELR